MLVYANCCFIFSHGNIMLLPSCHARVTSNRFEILGFFAQSMMISGTDQGAQPATSEANSNITRQIAENLDCTTDNPQDMMTCLRTRSYDELINASYTIYVITVMFFQLEL